MRPLGIADIQNYLPPDWAQDLVLLAPPRDGMARRDLFGTASRKPFELKPPALPESGTEVRDCGGRLLRQVLGMPDVGGHSIHDGLIGINLSQGTVEITYRIDGCRTHAGRHRS